MGRTCSKDGAKRNEGGWLKLFWSSRMRWCGLDSSGSGQGKVESPCECVIESSGSMLETI
jgi:hypothetical protein